MKEQSQFLKIYDIRFWRNYLIQMRPYLFFVSGVVGLAGMALTEDFNLISVSSFLAFTALFFSYGFGQAYTDCFQTDTDKISAPYRPLSKGILKVKDVKKVSLAGLILVAVTLVILNPVNLILCLLAIFGTWTYTVIKRKYWFAGPGYNALILTLMGLMGFLALHNSPLGEAFSIKTICLGALVFFSYSNFVLIGYLKDISADRATGYQTFPVKFGWVPTVWMGDLALLISSILYFYLIWDSELGLIIGIVALVLGITGQLSVHLVKEQKEENAAYAIVTTVRCMVLWLLGVVLTFNPGLWLFAVIFYIAFELVMYHRPMHGQI